MATKIIENMYDHLIVNLVIDRLIKRRQDPLTAQALELGYPYVYVPAGFVQKAP